MRSLSRSFPVRVMQSFLALTMRVKGALNPMLVTGVSEANSFYRREAALACGGYDSGTRVGEGIVLFRNLRKTGAPIIFTGEELMIATSGRRQEKQGAVRWFLIGSWNTTLQLLGRKGVDHDAYPDIR